MQQKNIKFPGALRINNNSLGILFILLHSSLDVVFYIICKYDAQNNYNSSIIEEIIFVFAYNLKSVIMLMAFFLIQIFLAKKNLIIAVNKIRFKIYSVMSFFSVIGFITFLYSLQDIMLANAMSIKYVEQILWVIIGTTLLGEKLNRKQAFGIFISITGVGIVIFIHLESADKTITYFLPGAAAICWTISSNIGKHLISSKIDILTHMICYYLFHVLILLCLLFLFVLFSDTKVEYLWINLLSYEFLIHILSMIFFYKALKITPMSLLAPFIYIKLIISALLGHFVFLDTYSLLEVFAYFLIIFGGFKVLCTLTHAKFVIRGLNND